MGKKIPPPPPWPTPIPTTAMGKKSSRSSNAGGDAPMVTAFVLKMATHCPCDACADKLRAAVKDLTLGGNGIVSLDQSALAWKGELRVLATADPEKLRRRLRKATGKSVDLVFPKLPAKPAADGGKDAAAAWELLAGLTGKSVDPVFPKPAADGGKDAASEWELLAGLTGKSVDLVFPKPASDGGKDDAAVRELLAGLTGKSVDLVFPKPAAAMKELLAGLQQQPVLGAYPHDGLGGADGGGWLRY